MPRAGLASEMEVGSIWGVDAALSAGVRSGQLADQVRQLARRRFVAMGIPKQDIEDLVQETVTAFISTAGEYDSSRGTMSSWVSGFAKNIARAWWRSSADRRTLESPLASLDGHPDESDRFETPAALEDALRTLSPLDQELLQLRFSFGYSFDEIETLTGMTSAAARKRVSRAIEQLRQNSALRTELGMAALV